MKQMMPFVKSHPLLAQKVVTRSACAAVSKIGADSLVSKALSVGRAKAGSLSGKLMH